MAKVLSEEDSEKTLAAREEEALEELRERRFKVTIHTPRSYVAPDPLLGIVGGYKPGECYAVAYSTDGRRRGFSGISATQVLADVRSWVRHQSNVEPPMRFEIADEFVAVPVSQRAIGDTAETAARRKNTLRRIIAFEGDVPVLVDSHGSPLTGDGTQAPAVAG